MAGLPPRVAQIATGFRKIGKAKWAALAVVDMAGDRPSRYEEIADQHLAILLGRFHAIETDNLTQRDLPLLKGREILFRSWAGQFGWRWPI